MRCVAGEASQEMIIESVEELQAKAKQDDGTGAWWRGRRVAGRGG